MQDKYNIAFEKITQMESLLEKNNIDTLLMLAREGSDSNLPFIIGIDSIHLGVVFINKNKKHIALTSESDKGNYEESGIFSQVITYENNIKKSFIEVFNKINPNKIALNISEDDNLCDGLTVGLYLMLEDMLGKDRLKEIEVSSEAMLSQIRAIKSPTELEYIQGAINHTTDIYDEVFSRVECGMTELQIADLMIEGMKKRGLTSGIGEAYDYPIVCIVRKGLAHRNPGNHKTQPGDVIVMDFSVRYKGYVSDIARSAYVLRENETQAPKDIQHVFETAYSAITKSIEFITAGKRGYEVDAVGRKAIEDGGYPTVRHSVGHQIGRQCHDGGTGLSPNNRPNSQGIIQLGEVYAIEPTVIQDDFKPSMIVEENVVIEENGARVLSKRQESLYLVPFKGEC